MARLWAAGYKSYKILGEDNACEQVPNEEPVDLGTRTVYGSKIAGPNTIFFFGKVKPEPVEQNAPVFDPQPRLQTPREEAPAFTFGRCSRSLRGAYSDLEPEEQAKISNRLLRHDDVAWTAANTSTKEAAGFFPVSFNLAAVFRKVPGEIRDAYPSEKNCNSWGISEANYNKVDSAVSADKADPPEYNLASYNCQDWADDIEALVASDR